MPRFLLIAALIALSACGEMHNWGDTAAEYVPIVGDRCDRLQCVGGDADVFREEYVPGNYGNPNAAPPPPPATHEPPREQRKRFPGPQ